MNGHARWRYPGYPDLSFLDVCNNPIYLRTTGLEHRTAGVSPGVVVHIPSRINFSNSVRPLSLWNQRIHEARNPVGCWWSSQCTVDTGRFADLRIDFWFRGFVLFGGAENMISGCQLGFKFLPAADLMDLTDQNFAREMYI